MTAVLQQRNPPRQQYNPRQPPHSSNGSQPQTPQSQSYTQSNTQNIPSSSTSASGSNGAVSTNSSGSATYNEQPRRPGGPNGASDVAGQNMMPHPTTNGESSRANGNGVRRLSDIAIQPHRRNQSSSVLVRPNDSREGSEPEQDASRRRPKPLLKRSKSDYGPGLRAAEESEDNQDNDADWGARHGFEGHYASEEYVSQLANVSRACLAVSPDTMVMSYEGCNITQAPQVYHQSARIKRCAACHGDLRYKPRISRCLFHHPLFWFSEPSQVPNEMLSHGWPGFQRAKITFCPPSLFCGRIQTDIEPNTDCGGRTEC